MYSQSKHLPLIFILLSVRPSAQISVSASSALPVTVSAAPAICRRFGGHDRCTKRRLPAARRSDTPWSHQSDPRHRSILRVMPGRTDDSIDLPRELGRCDRCRIAVENQLHVFQTMRSWAGILQVVQVSVSSDEIPFQPIHDISKCVQVEFFVAKWDLSALLINWISKGE